MNKDQKLNSGPRIQPDGGERLNGLFQALSTQRRRYMLYFLQQERRTNIDEVATQIAEWEHDQSTTAPSEEHVEQIRIDLVHNHIGVFREAGLIEYDRRTHDIVFRDPPRLIEAFLLLCAEIERPTSQR